MARRSTDVLETYGANVTLDAAPRSGADLHLGRGAVERPDTFMQTSSRQH
jgi:hypothetical protein